MEVEVVEVFASKGGSRNMSKEKNRMRILGDVGAGRFGAILATPPRSSFSRAKAAPSAGPRPLRSERFPRGFPWLGPRARKPVRSENSFVDFAVEALKLHLAGPGLKSAILLHPEDLGRKVGRRPASIWTWRSVREL